MRIGCSAAAVVLAACLLGPAAAQEADSLRLVTPTAADSAALPSPGGALWRALVAPGWGQVYVGQPVKAPFVVGALVGAGGLAVYLDGRYRLYRRAALYAGCQEVPGRPECEGAEAFEADWQATGARTFSATRQVRDDFRRNRDLAVLGTAAVYLLQVLDAYVAAHLAGFDVSEDLSVHVVPTADGPAALLVVRL
ncbi:MAG TPA: DUF5683 domain-containing protein [Rubricoccaceae bacterium]|nr:DUF5683 domain-containing protein [Rubricoccaceae bacterium]